MRARLRTQDVGIVDEAGEPVPGPVVLDRQAHPGSGRVLPSQLVSKSGEPLPPERLGIEPDTSDFGTFRGVRPHRCP
ncbi:hypothetical protein ACFXAO_12425 [Streptomyces lavendulae]|uniref:hypothetical protein n=1 Tax=Streptomyces lavendulae TaxID=1914 RepID=UPI0036849F97